VDVFGRLVKEAHVRVVTSVRHVIKVSGRVPLRKARSIFMIVRMLD